MRIVRIFLALALLGSLAGAGVRIYRRLPATAAVEITSGGAAQDLTIVMRVPGASETRVKLYPIDFAKIERDFGRSPRPDKSFEDFLAMRLKDVSAITANTDANGRATVHISEGAWWIRAVTVFPEGEWLEWRQQVNVATSPQTIELYSDNAYQRSKKF
ncbi:MAG TPA: hypothetical protein VE863_11475 [Pyrinomonadaceae bacterium]|jgi:hypothetical protein|nr:hypothetical protein [Pyrinomonadaceae bacterium]